MAGTFIFTVNHHSCHGEHCRYQIKLDYTLYTQPSKLCHNIQPAPTTQIQLYSQNNHTTVDNALASAKIAGTRAIKSGMNYRPRTMERRFCLAVIRIKLLDIDSNKLKSLRSRILGETQSDHYPHAAFTMAVVSITTLPDGS